MSEQWFNGHPVYENEKGQFLYMKDNGDWTVGSSLIGWYADGNIYGSPGYLCPSKSTKWGYMGYLDESYTLDEYGFIEGGITVSCSEYR